MARRIVFPVLFACVLLASSIAQAQEWQPPGAPHGWMPAALSFKRSGHPGRIQYGGATDAAVPLNYANEETAVPGVPYYGPDEIVTSRVPFQPDWVEPTPFEATVAQVFQRSWYRLEYLLWDIEQPGKVLLGAPLRSTAQPQRPFPVFDLQIPPNRIGNAFVPTLEPIGLRDNNGLRGTIGVPTTFGAVEASVFALAQASDSFSVPGLKPQEEITSFGGLLLRIRPGRFAATSLLDRGEVSDIVELYNRSFRVDYQSDIMGAEANFIFSNLIHYGLPGGLEIQPMVGFRYLLIQEQLRQVGQFEDITGQAPLLTSVIDSDTSNNLFGPSIGTRVEFQHPWFTLGVNPKVTFATDAYRARVTTERFRLAADPTVVTQDRSAHFSPITELQAYAHIPLSENVRFNIGYSLLYLAKITRPHDNIYYNDNGPFPTPPGVVLKPSTSGLRVEGLTAGIEIILP